MSTAPLDTEALLGEDSPRITRLKERLLDAPYEICLERARHFTRVYRQTEGLHPALRNALALKTTCESQPVRIYPDEWLVGNKTDKFLAPVLAPERGDSLKSLQMEIDAMGDREHPFLISPEGRREFLKEILPYWNGKTLRDLKAACWLEAGLIEPVRGNPLRTARQVAGILRFARHAGRDNLRLMAGLREGRKPSIRRALTAWRLRDEVSKNNPNMGLYCYDVQGHLHLGVEKVVREGFSGIRSRAAARLSTLDSGKSGYEDRKAFLQSVIISMEAACTYAARLRLLARERASAADDPEERSRLERVAESLEHAPAKPARSFREAVQAAWLALALGEIQYGMHDVLGMGRADQYLYPLFRKDLDEGRLELAEALELLEELNLKLTANVSIVPEVGAESNATLGVSQHCVIIGGRDRGGGDATNELSFLMLDAYRRMGGAINQLSLRVHEGSPTEFLKKGVEVFSRTSGHAFFNDDVIVPALERNGLSREDALDYNIVGCIETSGGGNCFPCPGGHEVVLPAILYMTLTDGRYPAPLFGQKAGFSTGDPDSFDTFEQFLDSFRLQLSHNIDTLVRAVECKDRAYMELLPSPYVSALMDGCIESATDMTGGGARYDFTSIIGRGLGTTVDSLLAIEDFVYERREFGISELVAACLSNFSESEDLRMRLALRAGRYGRDEEEADRMARRVVDMFADEVEKHVNARGGGYRAGMYSYGNHVLDGFYIGATPDGRRRGEPVSNGISPCNRVGEGKGLTALLKSAASIGQQRLSGGVSLNVRLDPACLSDDDGVSRTAAVVRSYFDLGGMHVQPNVVSDSTLKEAQRHPVEHRGLVVKVAGYSAYFTDLGRSIQNDIIDRHQFDHGT